MNNKIINGLLSVIAVFTLINCASSEKNDFSGSRFPAEDARFPNDPDAGDTTIKIGTLAVPLYKDLGNLQSDKLTQTGAKCDGMNADAEFTLKRAGNCVDVSYGYPNMKLHPEVRYCEGEKIRADGRDFKIVQVMDRCLIHPTTRKDKMYGNLFYQSLLVKLQSDDGTMWVTEEMRLQPLMAINNTQTVSGSGSCGKKHLLGRASVAEKCAQDLAKQNVLQMCTDMKGTAKQDSLKESRAPWMCYTEAFAEKYCATYTMTCDLSHK